MAVKLHRNMAVLSKKRVNISDLPYKLPFPRKEVLATPDWSSY